MDNLQQNNFENSQLDPQPFIQAESASDEEEKQRKKVARKRLFGVLLAIGVILLILLGWACIEFFQKI